MENNYMAEIRAAIRHARATGEWVVMLCPKGALPDCGKMLSLLLPSGTGFSGRTARLSGGGKISLADAEENLFVPDGVPFIVGFIVGCDPKGAQKWQSKASNMLQA